MKKKIRKNLGKLSFAMEDEDADESELQLSKPKLKAKSSAKSKDSEEAPKKRFGPNSAVSMMPKLMTKSALEKEAFTRDQLRKEFLIMQEAVKATEMIIPFVFYDGTNLPGGSCRVKKGDHVWFFLDKARKVGAGMEVGSNSGRKGWARISVDDLMFVRGDIIIPHVCASFLELTDKCSTMTSTTFW
jgi:protein FAM50